MDPSYSLAVRLTCEFIGTAILIILGNGTVANVHLKGSKGYRGGWSLIAMGYGFGVMIPAIMFGGISGNLINPAFTIGLATWGLFPWSEVAPYIVAQMLGAIAGQVAIVVTHKPYYDQTTDPEDILATFATINAARSRLNGFLVRAARLRGALLVRAGDHRLAADRERAGRRAPGARVPGLGTRRGPGRADRSGAQPGA